MVERFVYADDPLIPIEENNRLELEQGGAVYTPSINAWSLKVGFAVSTEKTVAMLVLQVARLEEVGSSWNKLFDARNGKISTTNKLELKVRTLKKALETAFRVS